MPDVKTPSPEANIAEAASRYEKKAGAKPKKKAEKPAKKEKAIPCPGARKRLAQIKRSEKLRKPFLEDADHFFRMYQGDYSKRGRGKGREQMSVNIIYSHVEIVTPAIFSGFPALKVRPKPKVGESTKEAESRAKSMELVINYWFKELGVDEMLRDVFLDTFFGPAFVEVGWETIIDDRQKDYEGENEEPIDGEQVTTIKDRPFVVRREFRNITLDSDARGPREGRWYGCEEVILWNDFQASSAYTDKAKAAVQPQLYPKGEEKENDERDGDTSEKEWVRIYTVWDRDAMKKYVLTDNYPGYLNSDDEDGEPWPYEMEYKDDPFPLCIHHAKRDRNTPYSWSEFRAYEPQIKELNRNRQALQIHVKASLPKYMATQALGEKQQINKLVNAKSDEITIVGNPQALMVVPVAEMPKDSYQMAVMSKEDLLDVSGLQEYQGGSLADTATEASIIEGRSKMRKTMRSKLWEQFVVEIGAKLAMLCQQNMDEAVAVEIAGPQGIEWLHVTKEQIQGEFFFDIEGGSMEYKNEAVRMQQFLKFSELMAQDQNVDKRALISKGAQMFDFQPEDILIPLDKMPPPAPPEPLIKFKDIEPLAINDPALMNQFVLTALRQNGVDVNAIVDEKTGAEEIGSNGMMAKLLLAAKGAKQAKIAEAGVPGSQTGPKPLSPGETAPQARPSMSGKDMAGAGANPNGNPALPPVQGNLNQGGNPNG